MSTEKREDGPAATVTVGSVVIKIYRVAAAGTSTGFTYKFRAPGLDGKALHGSSTDLATAKTRAKRVAKLLSEGLTAHVHASDISELLAARRLTEEHDVPLLPAVQEWSAAKRLTGPALLSVAKEHADAVADGTHKRVTHQEAWNRFIAAMDALGRKGERTYRAKSKMIVTGLGAGVMIDTIKKSGIVAWASSIRHPATRNELVKRLGTMLHWCQRNELFPADRAIPTDTVDRAIVPPEDPGIVTPTQLKKCLDWLRQNHIEYLAAAALGSLGGMRSDEIHGKRSDKGKTRADMPRQRWSHIHIKPLEKDGTCGHFTVSVAKKNTPSNRKAPILPALAAWLALCPRDGDFVCIAGAMERVRELLRKADADLGLPRVEVEIAGEKVMVNDLPENCFRHAWISHRLPVVGIVQTAAEAGNSPSEIERSYRVPMTLAEAEEYWKVMP